MVGYLEQFVDAIVVRHNSFELVKRMAAVSNIPVVNAMTKENHPCEILSDLYALSKIRNDFTKDQFLFIGAKGNIGNTWKEASDLWQFGFTHCCPEGNEIDGAHVSHNIVEAVQGKDIVCTDSIPAKLLADFKGFTVTKSLMETANEGAVCNPCPPFFRGEEISENVIDSGYFVGYDFKKSLIKVQQAILLDLLGLE